jgi:hypothetical protein
MYRNLSAFEMLPLPERSSKRIQQRSEKSRLKLPGSIQAVYFSRSKPGFRQCSCGSSSKVTQNKSIRTN